MKKLLIATTALVGTASVAAADITFSGYGRFGIQYDENRQTGGGIDFDADGNLQYRLTDDAGIIIIEDEADPSVIEAALLPTDTVEVQTIPTSDAEETRLEERFRLNIDASTETDGGVRFAVRIRAQSDDTTDGRAGDLSWNAPRFQVSAGGFRVRVGNISGVTDAAEVVDFFGYEPGLTGKTGHYATFGGQVLGGYDAYDSNSGDNGNTGINIKYEAGPFAVMASWSPDFDKNDPNSNTSFEDRYDDRMTWEVGASYTFSGWTLGGVYGHGDYNLDGVTIVGVDTTPADGFDDTYSFDDEYNWWAITASGSVGPADIALFVGNTDLDSDLEAALGYDDKVAYGVSGSYPVGAATNIVGSIAGGGDKSLKTAYGIGFDHSLGGGVTLKGMGGQDAFGNTIADLGVIFNF
jgi:outer membrane protein OmpU